MYTLCRSSRAVPKPNFRALDIEDEDEDWSSEDTEAALSGRKRRGRRSRSQGSSRSRHRNTAAVGELEAAAHEAEVAVAELAPQAEAWKEKYNCLVEENEALKRRVEELMKQAALRGDPSGVLTQPLLPPIDNNIQALVEGIPGLPQGVTPAVPSATISNPTLLGLSSGVIPSGNAPAPLGVMQQAPPSNPTQLAPPSVSGDFISLPGFVAQPPLQERD